MLLSDCERVQCRSCSKWVVWVRTTPNNKAMMLDPTPCDDGNVVLTAATVNGAPVVRTLKKNEAHTGLRYKSHFSTCPQSREWRNKR